MCHSCDYCVRYKKQRSSKIANTSDLKADEIPEPLKFGDAVAADHEIIGPTHESGSGDRVCLLLVDRFTRWISAYPAKTKDKQETVSAFKDFQGVKVFKRKQHLIGIAPA